MKAEETDREAGSRAHEGCECGAIAGLLTTGDDEMRILRAFALAVVVSLPRASAVAASDDTAPGPGGGPTATVVLTSEVGWEPLNPARGDQSPMAGTLWGDRNGRGPTGFLLRPADGFESPPHIHNVSYRGIVISGLIHNDDPGSAERWMPVGSFWTQPKGDVHITAAKGESTLAYIEIEEGPYLVRPVEEAFRGEEVPINVDASNLVWVEQPGLPSSSGGPTVAFLWGSPKEGQLNGTLVKLPAGFDGSMRNGDSDFRAVVIRGRPAFRVSGEADVATTLDPGSFLVATRGAAYQVACGVAEHCILYVRTEGTLDVLSSEPER